MNATVTLDKPAHLLAAAGHRTKMAAALATGKADVVGWLAPIRARHRANTAVLDDILRTAHAHGWTVSWRPLGIRHYMQALDMRRGAREHLRLDVDSSAARITHVYGEVATGPVTRRHVDGEHWITADNIRDYLAAPAAADYPDTEWVLVVGPDYVERRSYETACNYAEYRVTPGIYPVELTDLSGNAITAADRPYYAEAVAPSVRFHEYYVNRLGAATSVSESWDERPAETYTRRYAYELADMPRQLPEDMTGRAVIIRRADLPA